MKAEHIVKNVVLKSTVVLCILFFGCSRAYVERTDRWIKDYREHEIRPSRQVFLSNECRRPRPVPMGAPNINFSDISIDPGSINVSAP